MEPVILVAGCGYVGAEAVRQAGSAVGVVRTEASAEALRAAGLDVRVADLASRSGWASLRGPWSGVLLCPSTRGGGAREVRELFLPALEGAARAAGGGPVVLASSTAVYGEAGGRWVDESWPACGEASAKAGALAEVERAALARGFTVARLGGIYGPGRGLLLRRLLSGEARIVGRADRHLNQIHRDDAAAALLFLLGRGPRVVNAVDGCPVRLEDFYRWACARTGRPFPPAAEASRSGRRPPGDRRVSGRLLREMGFRFRHPSWREGYEALLAEAP